MDKTQIIVFDAVALIIVLFVALVGLMLLRNFIRRLQGGKGMFGSVLQESRDIARERLQVERELLIAQKETNELLKQMVAKQKP